MKRLSHQSENYITPVLTVYSFFFILRQYRDEDSRLLNKQERGSLCFFPLDQNGTDSFTRSLACTPHWQQATTDSSAL